MLELGSQGVDLAWSASGDQMALSELFVSIFQLSFLLGKLHFQTGSVQDGRHGRHEPVYPSRSQNPWGRCAWLLPYGASRLLMADPHWPLVGHMSVPEPVPCHLGMEE